VRKGYNKEEDTWICLPHFTYFEMGIIKKWQTGPVTLFAQTEPFWTYEITCSKFGDVACRSRSFFNNSPFHGNTAKPSYSNSGEKSKYRTISVWAEHWGKRILAVPILHENPICEECRM